MEPGTLTVYKIFMVRACGVVTIGGCICAKLMEPAHLRAAVSTLLLSHALNPPVLSTVSLRHPAACTVFAPLPHRSAIRSRPITPDANYPPVEPYCSLVG